MASHRRSVLAISLLVLVALPAVAHAGDLPDYDPDEFNLLFLTAPLDGLDAVGPAPAITGSDAVDERIRELAEARGYERRPLPSGGLWSADGIPVQPGVVSAWELLQDDARAHGHSISLVSGYRSHADQVGIFVGKLRGTSDSAIETRLRTAAPPGFSKHHTGYAVDVAAPGSAFTSFGTSAAFRWLSADNAEAAKRNGFIPSYPDGAASQGPKPEPWEWTYVGVDVVVCGRSTLGMPLGSFDDAVSCPDYPLARGPAAHLLVRALGLSDQTAGTDVYEDDAGLSYERDIDLLGERGLTAGCGPTTFCPFGYLTRGELASVVVDALSLGGVDPAGTTFDDLAGSFNAADIRRLDHLGIIAECDERSFCPDAAARRRDLLDLVVAARAVEVLPAPDLMIDVLGSEFEDDAMWLAASGITSGCNPPFGDLFCPDGEVTRGQMAAFLVRGLDLAEGSVGFDDTADSVFAADISALAAAGITRGCDPPVNDLFCPDDVVTRGQMAAFLVRGLGLAEGSVGFDDTADSVFAADISALAAAGITRGCDPPVNDSFCPDDPVTRGQMAAFLRRALSD